MCASVSVCLCACDVRPSTTTLISLSFILLSFGLFDEQKKVYEPILSASAASSSTWPSRFFFLHFLIHVVGWLAIFENLNYSTCVSKRTSCSLRMLLSMKNRAEDPAKLLQVRVLCLVGKRKKNLLLLLAANHNLKTRWKMIAAIVDAATPAHGRMMKMERRKRKKNKRWQLNRTAFA